PPGPVVLLAAGRRGDRARPRVPRGQGRGRLEHGPGAAHDCRAAFGPRRPARQPGHVRRRPGVDPGVAAGARGRRGCPAHAPLGPAAAGEGAPAAATDAGAGVAVDFAPSRPREPGRDAVFPDTEAWVGTEAPEGAPSPAVARAEAAAVVVGTARTDRLVWLGLGAAALSSLMHRAAWAGVLAPR